MWQYLKTVTKPILLYGMGNGADKILDRLNELEIPVAGVFASDGFVRHQIFRGYEVTSYSEAKAKYGNMVVLVCFGSSRPDVIELIERVAAEQELYAPDVPVYGGGIFDMEYYHTHQSELDEVYSMLEDDTSRKTFECTIEYRLTGKIEYLKQCETSSQEAHENILRLGSEEHYADLGAYTGDTVAEFLHYTNGKYESILAVEPDRKNFKKLLKNTDGLTNCRCMNVAINDRFAVEKFAMRGGRNSAVSNSGVDTVLDSLDNLLAGKPATYIKMDVEGQEEFAISGAKNTIIQYHPKMLISAYHRTEDYWSIPLKIKKIQPDYKVFMRHYPYIPAWDTNFFFI